MQLQTNLLIAGILMISQLLHAQTPTFLSNFEDQNTDPEIGGRVLLETGTSGGFDVVPNPHPDGRNSSDYVLRVFTKPGTGGRAEYTAGRYETNEKTYIYTYKRFHTTDMFKDIKVTGWVGYNQFKTWPCESGGKNQYAMYDTLICYGGGIFNDIIYVDNETAKYVARAEPCCKVDYFTLPKGYWNEFVFEVYWTTTTNGYYRLWRNDTLISYSNNIKTLFDEFPESGACNMNWSVGLYTYWEKTGEGSQDSLKSYIDDVALYDIDNGFSINSVCPDCEIAPPVPTDSVVYKINVNRSFAVQDGYNNYIARWKGDTSALNVSSTFGQSNGIDIYLFSDAVAVGGNSLTSDCFPTHVISTSVSWSNTETYQINLKDLNPSNTYTFKLLGATSNSGATRGTQIWTKEENRDTVFAANNTCYMAELTGLVSDENGNLTINISTINGGSAYINAIEIVEYLENHGNTNKNSDSQDVIVFPNPVKNNLYIMSDSTPSSITIYTLDGRQITSNQNTNTINLSHLNQGIYIAVINQNGTLVTKKIIKE